jgi:5,6,7,8-tetrahydromethanopterin hydro-lyase
MEIGEGFVGSGANAAHVNTVLGERSGPVGSAWAGALAGPSAGHAPFLVVAQPGVAACPPTVFVNKAAIASPAHARLTWGAAQAGVAAGIATALRAGAIDPERIGELCLIAAVWVDPAADDEDAVFANNASATAVAIETGHGGGPGLDAFLDAAADPWSPFFRPKLASG